MKSTNKYNLLATLGYPVCAYISALNHFLVITTLDAYKSISSFYHVMNNYQSALEAEFLERICNLPATSTPAKAPTLQSYDYLCKTLPYNRSFIELRCVRSKYKLQLYFRLSVSATRFTKARKSPNITKNYNTCLQTSEIMVKYPFWSGSFPFKAPLIRKHIRLNPWNWDFSLKCHDNL